MRQRTLHDAGSHVRAGFLERLVAQNLAALLLERGWPTGTNTEVTEFIEGWLLTLVIVPTPSGDSERQRKESGRA